LTWYHKPGGFAKPSARFRLTGGATVKRGRGVTWRRFLYLFQNLSHFFFEVWQIFFYH
jgi:hypothetical protein